MEMRPVRAPPKAENEVSWANSGSTRGSTSRVPVRRSTRGAPAVRKSLQRGHGKHEGVAPPPTVTSPAERWFRPGEFFRDAKARCDRPGKARLFSTRSQPNGRWFHLSVSASATLSGAHRVRGPGDPLRPPLSRDRRWLSLE